MCYYGIVEVIQNDVQYVGNQCPSIYGRVLIVVGSVCRWFLVFTCLCIHANQSDHSSPFLTVEGRV